MRPLPVIVSLVGFLVSHSVIAEESNKQLLIKRVKEIVPNAEVSSVNASPVAGLYEVIVGKSDIVYMSADGRFMLKGDLLDLNDRRNLTEERRGEARLNALKSMNPKTMIEFAPANAKHVIYVYTDVDCTYCRRFHQEVGVLNQAGITVRYLAFPRAGIGSESFRKTVSVWCATCDNPVKAHYESGITVGVKGTPTIILESGEELGGYVPAEKLVQYINGNAS
jgi:thiol:disulfide interchange protein DsbC